jgi:hypothetical protein
VLGLQEVLVMPGVARVLPVLALVLGALDLAPSLAHVLEAPPRLWVWPLDLWREATVFNGQFAVFGLLGAPLELSAIVASAALAWSLRAKRGGRTAAFAAALFGLALVAWVGLVAPANAVLAGWTPGPLPPDAADTRLRWEAGHMVCAALKAAAFVLLAIAAARTHGPRVWRRPYLGEA